MKYILGFFIILVSQGCYQTERNCKDYKEGTFTYTTTINEEEKTTTFQRKGKLEVATFEGKTDSSSVRWINDCEYVVKNLRPKNRDEEQSIHMKILTTTDNSYTFEYSAVGSSKKLKGTAIRKTN